MTKVNFFEELKADNDEATWIKDFKIEGDVLVSNAAIMQEFYRVCNAEMDEMR